LCDRQTAATLVISEIRQVAQLQQR